MRIGKRDGVPGKAELTVVYLGRGHVCGAVSVRIAGGDNGERPRTMASQNGAAGTSHAPQTPTPIRTRPGTTDKASKRRAVQASG